jgi:hypothetical protein
VAGGDTIVVVSSAPSAARDTVGASWSSLARRLSFEEREGVLRADDEALDFYERLGYRGKRMMRVKDLPPRVGGRPLRGWSPAPPPYSNIC